MSYTKGYLEQEVRRLEVLEPKIQRVFNEINKEIKEDDPLSINSFNEIVHCIQEIKRVRYFRAEGTGRISVGEVVSTGGDESKGYFYIYLVTTGIQFKKGFLTTKETKIASNSAVRVELPAGPTMYDIDVRGSNNAYHEGEVLAERQSAGVIKQESPNKWILAKVHNENYRSSDYGDRNGQGSIKAIRISIQNDFQYSSVRWEAYGQ